MLFLIQKVVSIKLIIIIIFCSFVFKLNLMFDTVYNNPWQKDSNNSQIRIVARKDIASMPNRLLESSSQFPTEMFTEETVTTSTFLEG